MNVYKKLQEARVRFHKLPLQKSGENKFAGYKYFELGDFLPAVQDIFHDIGLCGIVSFESDKARLSIIDTDKPDEFVNITSPMGSAALKGCHEVQNIGAVETYQRRYLWVTAMEIVENDAIDAAIGSEKKSEPVVAVKPKVAEIKHKKPDPLQIMVSMEKEIFADNWPGVYKIFYETGLDKATQADVWNRLENVTKDYLKTERAKHTNG
jgi:hypothetical protein